MTFSVHVQNARVRERAQCATAATSYTPALCVLKCSKLALWCNSKKMAKRAQRISASKVIQYFAGEDPESPSEAFFDGSDDDLGMDFDSDTDSVNEGMQIK